MWWKTPRHGDFIEHNNTIFENKYHDVVPKPRCGDCSTAFVFFMVFNLKKLTFLFYIHSHSRRAYAPTSSSSKFYTNFDFLKGKGMIFKHFKQLIIKYYCIYGTNSLLWTFI